MVAEKANKEYQLQRTRLEKRKDDLAALERDTAVRSSAALEQAMAYRLEAITFAQLRLEIEAIERKLMLVNRARAAKQGWIL